MVYKDLVQGRSRLCKKPKIQRIRMILRNALGDGMCVGCNELMLVEKPECAAGFCKKMYAEIIWR